MISLAGVEGMQSAFTTSVCVRVCVVSLSQPESLIRQLTSLSRNRAASYLSCHQSSAHANRWIWQRVTHTTAHWFIKTRSTNQPAEQPPNQHRPTLSHRDPKVRDARIGPVLHDICYVFGLVDVLHKHGLYKGALLLLVVVVDVACC